MGQYFTPVKLSERISETPEGYLLCEGVPITMAGEFMYAPNELPEGLGLEGSLEPVKVIRSTSVIHDPVTIASFEGKPITINHPDSNVNDGDVNPETWRDLSVGFMQRVRPGEGDDCNKLLSDFLIADAEAIRLVKSRNLREVSIGYSADFIKVGDQMAEQVNIVGNHAALVARGRCGPECAIFDSAPEFNQEGGRWMDFKNKLLGVFGKALDEAMTEPVEDAEVDMGEMLKAILARLEAIEMAINKPEVEPEEVEPEEVVSDVATETVQEACKDQEVIARAEIIAPGVAKDGDIKVNALKSAYASQDGKSVIDSLLSGKAFDSADKDLLFNATAEVMKSLRRDQIKAKALTHDHKPSVMTPEAMNKLNDNFYNSAKV